MKIKEIEVTVSEILDAMEKNGYPKGKNNFIEKKEDGVIYACAIGQAALNLGIDPLVLYDNLTFENKEGDAIYWGEEIAIMNDTTDYTVSQIANLYKEKLSYFLNEKLYLPVKDLPDTPTYTI